MKQKQKLWDMGYRDQTVIDSLGKRQASFLIDSIKGAENRAGAKAIGILAAILVVAAIVCCHIGGVWWCAGIPLWIFGGILGLSALSTLAKKVDQCVIGGRKNDEEYCKPSANAGS